ncbi:MAG: hypothetical protein V4525_02640 [Pseudomonadota bacterium]
MRVILLGLELINLSTAYHLAEIGYEVTLIEERTEAEIKRDGLSVYIENHSFIHEMDNKLRELGVHFRYGCKARKFVTEGKVVRSLSIINEYNYEETLVADRFVAALDYKTRPALKSLNISSPSQFKPFNNEHYHNSLIGKSNYSNLFLNVGQVMIGRTAVSQSGKQLADFIYNPSFAEFYDQPSFIKEGFLKIFSGLSNTIQKFFKVALITN